MSSKILYMRFIGEDPTIPDGFLDKYLSGLLSFIESGTVLNGTAHLNNTVFQYSFNLNNPKKAKIDSDIYMSDFEFLDEGGDKALKSLSLSVTYDSVETFSTLLDAVSPILARKKVPSAKITLGSDEQCISFKHTPFTPQAEPSQDHSSDSHLPDKVTKKQVGKKTSVDSGKQDDVSSYSLIKSGEETAGADE